MTPLLQKENIRPYIISIAKINMSYKRRKGDLFESLGKFIIKGQGTKEPLSTHIDEILYAKQ